MACVVAPLTSGVPVAVIENAKEKALAREFVELLLSPDGQEALARFGFQPGTRG